MNSFQIQEFNSQLPQSRTTYFEDYQHQEAPPRAPRLRAQQAPAEYHHMSLPISKDEFMSQMSKNNSCPTADMHLQHNNLILQSLTL